jgi:hypothetical protein
MAGPEGRASDAEPMRAEARETFERLEAKAWLDRVEAAAARLRKKYLPDLRLDAAGAECGMYLLWPTRSR